MLSSRSLFAAAVLLLASCTTVPDRGRSLAAARVQTACPDIPGVAAVLEEKDIRWLVIGEVHGSREIPREFARLVCNVAAKQENVVVAVEFPTNSNGPLQSYLSSNGDAAARAELLQTYPWDSARDGRTSVAMLEMLDTMRGFIDAELIAEVVPIQPSIEPFPGPVEYNRLMGENLASALNADDGMVIALVGRFHARTPDASNGSDSGIPAAASYLPVRRTLSFEVDFEGGETWACGRGQDCRVFELERSELSLDQGLVRDERAGPDFDGWLSLGRPLAPSKPAVDKFKKGGD